MRIGFVWDGNYPWDVRVEKICLSLIEAGHQVHMICRNTKYQPVEEIIDGIHIHRLPCLKISTRLNSMVNFPFFFNPVWYQRIKNVLNERQINTVIVRDITLSLTALHAARERNIPVILDMAEPYPEMIRAQYIYGDITGYRKIIRNVKMAEWVERKTLKKAAHIFAMIEESKVRMLSMGVPEARISIVSNTPDMRKYQKGRPSYPGSVGKLKSKTIFLYIGFIDLYRGLQIAITGFRDVVAKDKNAVLVVVGNGKSEEKMRRLAHELDIADSIIFEGYQDHSLILDYVASCDVGIIPHFSCGLWNNTIPNKLFDYMAMSKPVLSSDTKPVKRIIEAEECGLVYADNNPSGFAKQALNLMSPELRQKFGENGAKAIVSKYNWENDSRVLLDVIDK